MIKKFTDIEKELNEMREFGHPKGDVTGFKGLDDLYSIKQGSFTFVLAPPHHGKSEFCFELIFNQAEKYGKKTLVYSPETGSVADIYAEFIHKFTGNPIYKSINNCVKDDEYYKAVNYIDEMFSVVDSDEKSYSFKDLTKLVTDEQLILCDPYNEMNHDMSKYGSRQDLYIEDLAGEIRRYCKKNKKHCIMTLHPASQQKLYDKKSNTHYFPMPTAREAAGGQALFRKAMTWINMWRPDVRLLDVDGMPYAINEVHISIEKAKPKGVAKRGQISLFFDWKKNRYFEKFGFKESYAFDHEKIPEEIKSIMQPSQAFEPTKVTDADIESLYKDEEPPF